MSDQHDDVAALEYYRHRSRSSERINYILRTYMFLGIATAIFGTGYIVYSRLRISLSYSEQLALASTFVGGLTAFISWSLSSFRQAILSRDERRFSEQQAAGRFIEAWPAFEEAIRKRVVDGSERDAHFSIRESLDDLRKKGVISSGDQIDAEGLLQFRNMLVHGAQRFSTLDVDNSLKRLVELLSRLS